MPFSMKKWIPGLALPYSVLNTLATRWQISDISVRGSVTLGMRGHDNEKYPCHQLPQHLHQSVTSEIRRAAVLAGMILSQITEC